MRCSARTARPRPRGRSDTARAFGPVVTRSTLAAQGAWKRWFKRRQVRASRSRRNSNRSGSANRPAVREPYGGHHCKASAAHDPDSPNAPSQGETRSSAGSILPAPFPQREVRRLQRGKGSSGRGTRKGPAPAGKARISGLHKGTRQTRKRESRPRAKSVRGSRREGGQGEIASGPRSGDAQDIKPSGAPICHPCSPRKARRGPPWQALLHERRRAIAALPVEPRSRQVGAPRSRPIASGARI